MPPTPAPAAALASPAKPAGSRGPSRLRALLLPTLALVSLLLVAGLVVSSQYETGLGEAVRRATLPSLGAAGPAPSPSRSLLEEDFPAVPLSRIEVGGWWLPQRAVRCVCQGRAPTPCCCAFALRPTRSPTLALLARRRRAFPRSPARRRAHASAAAALPRSATARSGRSGCAWCTTCTWQTRLPCLWQRVSARLD